MGTFTRGLTNCSIGQLNPDGSVEPFISKSRAELRYLVRVDHENKVWLDYEDGQTRESGMIDYRDVLQRTRNSMWREAPSALAARFGPAKSAALTAQSVEEQSDAE